MASTRQSRRWLLRATVVAAAVSLGGVTLTGTAANAGTVRRYAPHIDPAKFTTQIDNPYLPLQPGTRWVYEGRGDRGAEHTVVEVTPDTRVIMGVTTVVVRDTVSVGGTVAEDTFDWYAQDVAGNVWYFGEDTKEYAGSGKVSTKGSWEAGVAGAQPGIVMKAHPKRGALYRQEYQRGEAEDQAAVVGFVKRVSVRFGAFTHVLLTKELTALEPGLLEHKYYASGVGVVRELTVHGGSDRSELVEFQPPA
jgi:hypothetical protein